MLTHDYSYASCLDGSVHNAWTVEDCFQGRDFDFAKPFLPERIAGVSGISCLNGDEKRLLNQIRGNSYCHIFAFVEEYIVPMVLANATRDVYGDETRLWALVRFAEEEIKHQEMLRRACDQFEKGFGTPCGLIPGREAVADVVLAASPLTALLLTSMIEWFTQLHYVEHVRDGDDLDRLFRDILRFHWIDESRHARLDSMLINEVASELSAEERERSIDELLDLGGAVDGLLAQQVELDIEALEHATGRSFTEAEKSEIRGAQQHAYRWTFLVSGLEHPKFTQIVADLTTAGSKKLADAAAALAAAG
jgi:P-aminobenzoate N-oxygenase AurF